MRLLGKVALGGGLVSAATATLLVAAGVLATSATLVASDPVAPGAAADPRPLVGSDSCSSLLDWYVGNAVSDVGPYGWNLSTIWAQYRGELAGRVSALDAAATAAKAPVSRTGTNTQEAAVDEPDVAKTNGTLLVRIENQRTLVVTDISGPGAREVARLPLTKYGHNSELLLAGDHVLVTQQLDQSGTTTVGDGRQTRTYYAPGRTVTRILDVDLSDPAHPRTLSRDRYRGRLLSARQYGGTVRVVTATERPELPWTYPSKKVSRREATRANRALVRRTQISDWLPSVTRDGRSEPLVDCENVLHPRAYAGDETVVVTTFAAESPDQRSAVGVTADGGIIYSSEDRLYLATSDYPDHFTDGPVRVSTHSTTAIHAFDLTTPSTTYVGSGEITGSLRDRWSLDEYEGRLRVAWTRSGPRGGTRNGITILTERGADLVPTAKIGNLGIDEDLQSVRWFDDLAVLVTFRQVDPLYTLDLSDPEDPVLRGKLKIPGYSGYLHPIGDNLLLGLGMSGGSNGLTSGSQAAVFDISDLTKPVRLDHATWGGDTYFPALDDPRSFTWAAGSSTAIAPLSDWSRNQTRILALEVSATGKISARTVITSASSSKAWQTRSFSLPDGRIAILSGKQVLLLDGLAVD